MHSITSILIANRGEIACRIMRTAKSMGIRTIAVYSQADQNAPHVKMADEAILLGPAPVHESYLNMDKILAAIKATNADAVHPGYGFLSENASVANACEREGVIFIGPNVDAIDIMGDKAKSKRRMIDAGVPCIAGYQGEDQSDETLISKSADIGFPLMVKAAAGGGGRGMRLVDNAAALASALKLARSEAQNAFGSGDLILEKTVTRSRHVEIQILADTHGNIIHLGERDCSVQRRHQKVLEESPCPVMTQDLRERMGEAAIKAAQNVNYVGAGTVEFLLDVDNNFYFLEMNTRLQVEHPVTELVTGLDLVALQIKIARGERLEIKQEQISLDGHAIEARLYAEDPSQDFLPATGSVDFWAPASGAGIRIDAGIDTGSVISPFYDPMIAKIIAHGKTREEARSRLIQALKETCLMGVPSNKKFLIDALGAPTFTNGLATTAFVSETFSEQDLSRPPISFEVSAFAAVLLYVSARAQSSSQCTHMPDELLNWTSASKITVPYRFAADDLETTISLTPESSNSYTLSHENQSAHIKLVCVDTNLVTLTINGERKKIYFYIPQSEPNNQTVHFSIEGVDYTLTNLNGIIQLTTDRVGAGSIIAPMHGLIVDIFVKNGETIKAGDKLAVLEAMKMQHELCAQTDGIIEKVHYEAGAQVAADTLLMEINVSGE